MPPPSSTQAPNQNKVAQPTTSTAASWCSFDPKYYRSLSILHFLFSTSVDDKPPHVSALASPPSEINGVPWFSDLIMLVAILIYSFTIRAFVEINNWQPTASYLFKTLQPLCELLSTVLSCLWKEFNFVLDIKQFVQLPNFYNTIYFIRVFDHFYNNVIYI